MIKTFKNGKQWAKAFINGKEVSVLANASNLFFQKSSPVPDDYPQKILTGVGEVLLGTYFKTTQNTKVEIKFEKTYQGFISLLYGGELFTGVEYNMPGIWESTNIVWGDGALELPLLPMNEPITLIQDKKQVYINGEFVGEVTNSTIEEFGEENFALYIVDESIDTTMSKFWYCKVWDNGALIGDFIPVRGGDNVYGQVAPSNCIYDKVTKTFLENEGTGSVIIEDT